MHRVPSSGLVRSEEVVVGEDVETTAMEPQGVAVAEVETVEVVITPGEVDNYLCDVSIGGCDCITYSVQEEPFTLTSMFVFVSWFPAFPFHPIKPYC